MTLNRSDAIDRGSVILRATYHHPVFTPAAVAAQARQRELNGHHGTYYCGAWWRNGFHEDGVVSAHGCAGTLRRGPCTARCTSDSLGTGATRRGRTRSPTRSTWHGSTSPSSTTVFKGRWFWSTKRRALAWFRRADYLGDAGIPLDEAVRRRVAEAQGQRPKGPIRMLAQLRNYGHCFNPVVFYYCYDPTGTRVETIVAEITNTPWRERHSYVLPVQAEVAPGTSLQFYFAKRFHVSPFMPMDVDYHWQFTQPGERLPCIWRTCAMASGSSTQP